MRRLSQPMRTVIRALARGGQALGRSSGLLNQPGRLILTLGAEQREYAWTVVSAMRRRGLIVQGPWIKTGPGALCLIALSQAGQGLAREVSVEAAA